MGTRRESSSSEPSGDPASGDERASQSGDENVHSEAESRPRKWTREEMEGAEGFPIPEVPDDSSNEQQREETNDD